jgi:ABC-type xylose transport system substrate-binding protein
MTSMPPPETSAPAAALPSYSAATTDPSLTNNDAENNYAYADFTIGDLRSQIIANAAIIKPIYTAEKARNEYELELVLMRGSTGQHAAMLLRRNVSQTLSYDTRHGKIVLKGKAHATPRQAYEWLLSKTETILGDMLRSSRIEYSLPREMHGWNPRQYD